MCWRLADGGWAEHQLALFFSVVGRQEVRGLGGVAWEASPQWFEFAVRNRHSAVLMCADEWECLDAMRLIERAVADKDAAMMPLKVNG